MERHSIWPHPRTILSLALTISGPSDITLSGSCYGGSSEWAEEEVEEKEEAGRRREDGGVIRSVTTRRGKSRRGG